MRGAFWLFKNERKRYGQTGLNGAGHLLCGPVLSHGGAAGFVGVRRGSGGAALGSTLHAHRRRLRGLYVPRPDGGHARHIYASSYSLQKEGFRFDAVYTGYLGSGEQITHVRHIMDTLLVPGGARIVDPAMADNGKLYAGFDAAFVEKMKTLAFSADILLPNITEAALLTGMEYRKEYDEAYIEELTAALHEKGVGTVVLTGVSYEPETTGVVVSSREFRGYYRHARLARTCHGTGDLFASAFTGLLCRGSGDVSLCRMRSMSGIVSSPSAAASFFAAYSLFPVPVK